MRDSLAWTPRVPKGKIKRLYQLEAAGLLDEALVEEVGIQLLLRCEDILAVEEARRGRVRCPQCRQRKVETWIPRRPGGAESGDEVITCPICSWTVTWQAYQRSFRRRQLNAGGAIGAFRAYVEGYRRAQSAAEKMLLIDRLLHEFHHSLRRHPHQPTRAVAVNLIEGNLTSVMALLDQLTYGEGSHAELRLRQEEWQVKAQAWRSWLDQIRARRASEPQGDAEP